MVKTNEPLSPPRECIIVPREVLFGLLTAIHIKLDNPTKHQLNLIVQRQFYALDLDKAIPSVSDGCHTCVSLMAIPAEIVTKSTGDPPPVAGVQFPADILKCN